MEPVLDFEEACQHPQIVARNLVVDVPKAEGTVQKQIGTAIKFQQVEPTYQFVGTTLGAHTEEILCNLGYAKEKIEQFKNSGVLD